MADDCAPVAAEAVPGEHAVHMAAFDDALYVPASQMAQLAAPDIDE